METIDTVHTLRSAASEIRRLRRQITEIKAEAWDVHSEVIKQIFSRSMAAEVCPAACAENMAHALEHQLTTKEDKVA